MGLLGFWHAFDTCCDANSRRTVSILQNCGSWPDSEYLYSVYLAAVVSNYDQLHALKEKLPPGQSPQAMRRGVLGIG